MLGKNSNFRSLSTSIEIGVSRSTGILDVDSAEDVGTATAGGGSLLSGAGFFSRQHFEHISPVALLPWGDSKKRPNDVSDIGGIECNIVGAL